MKTKFLLTLSALTFLSAAILFGTAVSRKASVDTFEHIEVFGSGFQRLKHFAASALYLQLDDYHHIAIFQGIPSSEVTDYLPQMWLISKLDPSFTRVYTDAAFHLAINMGNLDEGMKIIREGVENNPDSLDVRFVFGYLLWETGTGSNEEILDESLTYRSLVRCASGDSNEPYNEPSSATLLAEVFEARTDSLNPYSLFYKRRSIFVREATREGIYYSGYLAPAPHYLTAETKDGF